MIKGGYVYILASKHNGTLYIGMTSNLPRRMEQHRTHAADGFTNKYDVATLVWCESHDDIESAILREKQLKRWNRAWKLELIEKDNPEWRDLAEEVLV
jgi:putative endonuclease